MLSMLDSSLEIDNFIIQLIELLNNWNNYKELNAMLISANNETKSIKIFITNIHSANAPDQDYYICFTQFDIKESEIYARAI